MNSPDCKSSGSHSGLADRSSLLGCDTVLSGEKVPML
jgi:hypothetical protein